MLDEKTKARIIEHLSFEPQLEPDMEPWQNDVENDIEWLAFDFINTLDSPEVYSFLQHLVFKGGGNGGSNPLLRSRAFRAILNLKDRDPIIFLEELLLQPESGWRWAACRNLAEHPGSHAILLLAHTLVHDKDADVRFIAAESLGIVGDESGLPALQHAEQHDSGCDYEGFPIAEAARAAIRAIEERTQRPP
ncbi:HEAT repeat domain-containing protein [Deinococcus sp. YIM 134068]|uniref:HEAT repeat domain-containing protein n=1 Tax=Deinococcus lichenicola TaxID=3118910 RepID=UPI002F9439D1